MDIPENAVGWWIDELQVLFPDWQLPRRVWAKHQLFESRILDTLGLSSSPFTPAEKQLIEVRFDDAESQAIDVMQYLTMLQEGKWYAAIWSLLPASSDDTMATFNTMDSLRRHSTDEYLGSAIMGLSVRLSRDEATFNSAKQYSKSLDIIQSGGMGKSRLVNEMGKTIFTMTFALRKPRETGFPPGDRDIFDFILNGVGTDLFNVHVDKFQNRAIRPVPIRGWLRADCGWCS